MCMWVSESKGKEILEIFYIYIGNNANSVSLYKYQLCSTHFHFAGNKQRSDMAAKNSNIVFSEEKGEEKQSLIQRIFSHSSK